MRNKLFKIALNGLRTFVIPSTLFVISFLVVDGYGKAFWGEFIAQMLFINLTAHVLQWGNKDLLIRSFSNSPASLPKLFYSNFFTRSLFLIPAFAILLFISPNHGYFGWLVLWLTSQFIYQSAESLIVYSRRFGVQVIIDLISFSILFLFVWQINLKAPDELIFIFSIATAVKALGVLMALFPKPVKASVSFKELALGLPFFIIGFSGLIQSRVDQYIIALFCEQSVIGTYQIFLSAFILIQSFSSIIIVPFKKMLFRINAQTYNRFQLKVSLLGAVLVVAIGIIVSVILAFYYQLNIDWKFYLVGILLSYPPFVYVPIIFIYYRLKKEKEVIWVNYLGAGFNLIMTLVLVYSGNPFGAIVSSCIAQWMMLFWYSYRKKSLINAVEMSHM